MRLRESKDNYNATDVIRRDLRRGGSDDASVRTKSKKNVRRWCKGKHGVLHDYQLVAVERFGRSYVDERGYYQVDRNDHAMTRLTWRCGVCDRKMTEYQHKDRP